ncbi:MAG TPA: mechanosensitive ion channel domain-containing protein [Actinomycetales bacterium]|nr:mechanosensitive ion channel domain-containing protein [Actinomycetales bacterium]
MLDLDARALAAAPELLTDWLLTSGLRIALIVVLAVVVRWLVLRAIGRLVRRTVESGERLRSGKGAVRVLATATGAMSERRVQRTETLGSVLRSIVTVLVFGVAGLMVLDVLRVPIGPALASAGVAGVALGFGAQSLVKDVLSGVFMLVEDQYGVGDVVDVGDAVGTVEQVTLRVTKLRDGSGVAWYIRNGEIVRVANKSQGWSTAIVDLPVALGQDLDHVQRVVAEALERFYADEEWRELLLEEPTVAGVEQVVGATVTIRVLAKTAPNEHLGVQRAIRERVLTAFEGAGVRAPLPYPAAPGGPDAAGTPGTISGTV